MNKTPKISGTICPAITPFNTKNKVDFVAMEKHYQICKNQRYFGDGYNW